MSTVECRFSECEAGQVHVVHGINDGFFSVAGETVASIQQSLADAFNLPIEALAWVDGNVVGEDYLVRSNQKIEFILPWGTKAAKPEDNSIRPLLKTAYPYFGGKAAVAPEIWRRFGNIQNYVEPFFGGGGALLNRPIGIDETLPKETVNDIDVFVTNFWRAAKLHPRKLAKATVYPVSELDLHARHTWLCEKRSALREKLRSQEAWCDPKVAAWWVWGICIWIGSGWCSTGRRLSRQRPDLSGRGIQRNNVDLKQYFDMLSERLRRVTITNGDWSRLVTPAVTTRYGLTGILLDPPYTKGASRTKNLYANDDLQIGYEVRDWAVRNGGDPSLRIALCGYEGEYAMPKNWAVYEWKSRGSKNGHKERIWFSPHCLD